MAEWSDCMIEHRQRQYGDNQISHLHDHINIIVREDPRRELGVPPRLALVPMHRVSGSSVAVVTGPSYLENAANIAMAGGCSNSVIRGINDGSPK